MFVRMGVPAVGAVWFTQVRAVIAALVLLACAMALRLDLRWRVHWKHYLVIGAGNAALPWGLYAFAAYHLPAGYMAILNSTSP